MVRGSAIVIALLLSACSSGGDAGQQAAVQAQGGAADAAKPDAPGSVPCALAGARSFTGSCKVERLTAGGKTIITVRHPNGGFRRLVELEGGKRFAAADGSDEVSIERNGSEIEVTLGDDHYLFPAPASALAK